MKKIEVLKTIILEQLHAKSWFCGIFFFGEIQFILTSSTSNDKNVIKQKRYLLISSALTFPNVYGTHIHTLK